MPYSIEVGQDTVGLASELLKITADARDVLDASMFYSGLRRGSARGSADRARGRLEEFLGL